MVELSALLARLPAGTEVSGDLNVPIERIETDSRQAGPGALFVAVRGQHRDGHAYVGAALAAGASAAIVEEAHASGALGATVVHVPDSRRALSALSAAFFGDPSHALDVFGVTGTNGKTTTTRMIAAIVASAGVPCGVIGTLGAEFGERSWPLAHTTPQPPELHGVLAAMRDAGARAVAMEVSSHALELGRVDDVSFHTAALTNVTRDHLDFHGSLEAYAAAKHRLFAMAHRAVLNLDDEHGRRWHPGIAARVPTLTYALRGEADMVPSAVALTAAGSTFTLGATHVDVRLPGAFNVENALAAIGVARMFGIGDEASAHGLEQLERVAGRMEHQSGGGIDVIVDYAHTPDALERALTALRAGARGKVALVFGCGGERDRGKRPEMGAIAARLADRIYVTNDNPRSEDPHAIAAAIVTGIGAHAYELELDRRRAIELAIQQAQPGDIVLVAGKGHERDQIMAERVEPFDDVAVVRQALAGIGP